MSEQDDLVPRIHAVIDPAKPGPRIRPVASLASSGYIPPAPEPTRNHRDGATYWLERAAHREEGKQFGPAQRALSAAQVHATLYLADQQRIANLIAWQALTGEGNATQIREGLSMPGPGDLC